MENTSTIIWQTGTPKHAGEYLITTKHHEVVADMWLQKANEFGDHWIRHYDVDVIAWCELVSVEPFKF